MEYETHRYFDCSTSHIPHEDTDCLRMDAAIKSRHDSNPSLIVSEYDEGFWISIYPETEVHNRCNEEAKEAGYSTAILKLLNIAHEQECNFLRLDCDIPTHADLPTFDW